MLDTWVQQYLGQLPLSHSDTTSGAQIEEVPSESVNAFREDSKCSVFCVYACACVRVCVCVCVCVCV